MCIRDSVQALAVIAGIADQTQYNEIFNLFKSQKHASPYMEKYVMEALFIMGQSNYALERVQSRFAPMVDNEEYSTPVSYTHLDVYKRQGIHCCGWII